MLLCGPRSNVIQGGRQYPRPNIEPGFRSCNRTQVRARRKPGAEKSFIYSVSALASGV